MKIEAESQIFRREASETKSWFTNSSSNKGIFGRLFFFTGAALRHISPDFRRRAIARLTPL
jgi:hypothetical protein